MQDCYVGDVDDFVKYGLLRAINEREYLRTECACARRAHAIAPMRLRTAARGANADGQLWGCSQLPRCKATMAASGASEAVAERRRNPESDGPRSGRETARARRWTDRVGVEGHETTDVAIGSRPRWLTMRRTEDERVIAKLLDLTRILRRRRGAKPVPEMQRP